MILPYITQHYITSTTLSQQVSINTSHQHVVALDMSKAFDTVNIHTLIVKLAHHTQIHRKLHQRTHDIYTIREPFIYKMPIQIRSSTRRCPFTHTLQHLRFRHPTTTRLSTTYTDDITTTAPHADINIAKVNNIQPYLQVILKWTKDNDLLLYTDKITCTQSPQA